MKKIIYTTDYDYEEMEKNYIQNQLAEGVDITEDDIYNYINDSSQIWFDDEKINLDVDTDNGENIIAIADMGLWNGRRIGYKDLSTNTKDILAVRSICDYITIYYDTTDRQVKGKGVHHDGTNYVTFRKWKSNLSDNQKDKLYNAMYNGDSDYEKLLKRYTTSISKEVKKIYGW